MLRGRATIRAASPLHGLSPGDNPCRGRQSVPPTPVTDCRPEQEATIRVGATIRVATHGDVGTAFAVAGTYQRRLFSATSPFRRHYVITVSTRCGDISKMLQTYLVPTIYMATVMETSQRRLGDKLKDGNSLFKNRKCSILLRIPEIGLVSWRRAS